jgi:hypothetical protein
MDCTRHHVSWVVLADPKWSTAQVPLLVSLQPAQLSQLCAKMSAEHHDAGATIFSSVGQRRSAYQALRALSVPLVWLWSC